jgi:hypothetical protein
MGEQSREEFSKNLQAMRRRTMQDDRIHSFTMEFSKPGMAISCISAPPGKALELPARLKELGEYRMSKAKDGLWVGFASLAPSSMLISHFLVFKS